MNEREYWDEVRSLAAGMVEEIRAEAKENDWDEDQAREAMNERAWETIDGHQWVIYTHYNYDVLRFSPNDGYSIEEFGSEGIVDDSGLRTDKLAFGALYADVMEELPSEVLTVEADEVTS